MLWLDIVLVVLQASEAWPEAIETEEQDHDEVVPPAAVEKSVLVETVDDIVDLQGLVVPTTLVEEQVSVTVLTTEVELLAGNGVNAELAFVVDGPRVRSLLAVDKLSDVSADRDGIVDKEVTAVSENSVDPEVGFTQVAELTHVVEVLIAAPDTREVFDPVQVVVTNTVVVRV
ncbi:hypothetical protein ACHAPJ_003662 [Fusarium lateritium]